MAESEFRFVPRSGGVLYQGQQTRTSRVDLRVAFLAPAGTPAAAQLTATDSWALADGVYLFLGASGARHGDVRGRGAQPARHADVGGHPPAVDRRSQPRRPGLEPGRDQPDRRRTGGRHAVHAHPLSLPQLRLHPQRRPAAQPRRRGCAVHRRPECSRRHPAHCRQRCQRASGRHRVADDPPHRAGRGVPELLRPAAHRRGRRHDCRRARRGMPVLLRRPDRPRVRPAHVPPVRHLRHLHDGSGGRRFRGRPRPRGPARPARPPRPGPHPVHFRHHRRAPLLLPDDRRIAGRPAAGRRPPAVRHTTRRPVRGRRRPALPGAARHLPAPPARAGVGPGAPVRRRWGGVHRARRSEHPRVRRGQPRLRTGLRPVPNDAPGLPGPAADRAGVHGLGIADRRHAARVLRPARGRGPVRGGHPADPTGAGIIAAALLRRPSRRAADDSRPRASSPTRWCRTPARPRT